MNDIQRKAVRNRIGDLKIEIKDRLGRIERKEEEIVEARKSIDFYKKQLEELTSELKELMQ